MTGPRISDMNTLATLPVSGAVVPVVVGGLNYKYDLSGAILASGFFGTLSTTAALQAALDYIGLNGGTLIIPPGTYAVTAQLTLTPTTLKNIHIIGYGAEITTTGTISGFKISAAYWLPEQIIVEGVKVNHRGNTTATAGFELIHSNLVTFRNCVVEAHGVGASYAGFWFHQSNPADIDTGCFWNTLDGCTVRKRGSEVGEIPSGVKAQGAANACRVVGGFYHNCDNAIHFVTESGQTALANGFVIDGVWFETCTTAILAAQATTGPIGGLKVINCRGETLTTFFSLTGATTQPVVPAWLEGNYMTPSVTTHINNPNSLNIANLDDTGTGMNLPIRGKLVMKNVSGAGRTLELWAAATGQVIEQWSNNAGALLASMTWVTDANVALVELTGSNASLCLTGINGISQTTTRARNLRGTATFAAATTVAVSFATAEADASYFVQLTAQADPVGRLWVSGKGTGGFTINNSSSTSIAVDWLLIR